MREHENLVIHSLWSGEKSWEAHLFTSLRFCDYIYPYLQSNSIAKNRSSLCVSTEPCQLRDLVERHLAIKMPTNQLQGPPCLVHIRQTQPATAQGPHRAVSHCERDSEHAQEDEHVGHAPPVPRLSPQTLRQPLIPFQRTLPLLSVLFAEIHEQVQGFGVAAVVETAQGRRDLFDFRGRTGLVVEAF